MDFYSVIRKKDTTGAWTLSSSGVSRIFPGEAKFFLKGSGTLGVSTEIAFLSRNLNLDSMIPDPWVGAMALPPPLIRACFPDRFRRAPAQRPLVTLAQRSLPASEMPDIHGTEDETSTDY